MENHPADSVFSISGDSAVGAIVIEWSLSGKKPLVDRISFPGSKGGERSKTGGTPVPEERTCVEIDRLLDQINEFTNGKSIRFSLDRLRLDRCNEFQRNVLLTDFSIPRGRVSTYGCIARFLKIPGGARAVGTALASNPFPLVIPCHRVIRSDGSLGGYQGGLKMKRFLLEKEGLIFDERNRAIDPDFL